MPDVKDAAKLVLTELDLEKHYQNTLFTVQQLSVDLEQAKGALNYLRELRARYTVPTVPLQENTSPGVDLPTKEKPVELKKAGEQSGNNTPGN